MSTRPSLIALCGWGGSGKDTAAKALRSLGWEHRAFADPLRSLALECNPIVVCAEEGVVEMPLRYSQVQVFHGYAMAKELEPEFRAFLQRLGNGAREVFGDDFWVKQATRNITHNTIWTDCRYENEADAIRNLGGIVVKIKRPGVGPANEFEELNHGLPGYHFDSVIQNDGTEEELHEKIRLLLSHMR